MNISTYFPPELNVLKTKSLCANSAQLTITTDRGQLTPVVSPSATIARRKRQDIWFFTQPERIEEALMLPLLTSAIAHKVIMFSKALCAP
ncbi:hypothetical protein [Candidatus Colwellia aromaticivorans]|uniref:hypothetical protein n=1 Tax=Candidatus Colwellia aromaticivorans TaxID=2267621 RepID=UPI000DF3277A|nr:hypothetical protein [Candidatus Colwellia aromaticivorans]